MSENWVLLLLLNCSWWNTYELATSSRECREGDEGKQMLAKSEHQMEVSEESVFW